jgi:hypothetical protein
MLINRRPGRIARAVAFIVALAAISTPGMTQGIDRALGDTEAQRRADAESQRRIDQLDDATRQALQEYRSVVWQTQQLNVYSEQLQTLIDQQSGEIESLNTQLRELQLTEREIMPLMLRMTEALERFISLDMPFLREERRDRVANLKRTLGDPGESVADRFQRLLEAYKIESDYGRSLGTERTQIDERVHDVLRVGRVAMYALSLDGNDALRWDAAERNWKPLSGGDAATVRRGLRIARETAAPDLLLLPVPAPGGAQ